MAGPVLRLALFGATLLLIIQAAISGNPCDVGGVTVVYQGWTGECGGQEKNVDLNTESASVANQPQVMFSSAKPQKKYVLLMVDPDAPPKKPGQFWVHWIAANLNKDDLTSGNIPSSKTVLEYNPPTPPNGWHRYQFYVYEQKGSALTRPSSRGGFNMENYTKDQGSIVGGYQFEACKSGC